MKGLALDLPRNDSRGAKWAAVLSSIACAAPTADVTRYTGVSAASSHLSGRPSLTLDFVATAALLHVALLLWNFQAARWLSLAPANRTAVVICGSQKTLPNGIYLWGTFFPSNPHGALALVCYHVFQLVLDSLLLPLLKAEPAPLAGQAPGEMIDGA